MKSYMYAEPGMEECYSLDYFRESLGGVLPDQIVLERWEVEHGTGSFWCIEQGEGYESSEGGCGKFECSDYKPRNGKNGICVHHRLPHSPTGKLFLLTKDGLREHNP